MNIQTLTSAKNYNNTTYLPSDDAGLLRYSSSPPSARFLPSSGVGGGGNSTTVKPPSPPSPAYPSTQQQQHVNQQQPPYVQQQQQIGGLFSSSDNNNSDLQSVVSKYHANPDLLKLILASKVEEDKRRTEEAKLKAKELDLYLKQQEAVGTNRNDLHHQQQQPYQSQAAIVSAAAAAAAARRRRSSSSSTSSNGSLTTTTNNNTIGTVDSIHRRIAPYSIPRAIVAGPNNGNGGMIMPRRNSSVSSALNMNRLSINNNSIPLQAQQPQKIAMASSAPTSSQYLYPNLSSPSVLRTPTSSSDNNTKTTTSPPVKISRRRRSMQALTKLVETTEFPYDDGHFWKNNGNTVQKKTGCKSVYYKCANSCKGCPVNKTVVEQPNGSYLIKYRGDHIIECSQVEHVRDL